jgi:hypothetical protein
MKTPIFLSMLILCAWQQSPAQGIDIPVTLTVGSDGLVYVAGTSMSAAGSMEFVLLAYDRTGTLRGSARLPGSSAGASVPAGMIADGGNLIVTGTAPGSTAAFDMLTASFARSSVVSAELPPSADFLLSQSYPNPVATEGLASIRFTLPAVGRVRLNVVDAGGREVAVLVDATLGAGTHDAEFHPASLPAGTYFYTLASSTQSQVRKLAVVR